MNIQVIKNIHFTKLLKVNGRLREFNFRKIPGATELFHVDVSDDRGNRLMFRIQKDDGYWRIQSPQDLPQWVVDAEQKLAELIQEEAA
jgi:hypothetical protein